MGFTNEHDIKTALISSNCVMEDTITYLTTLEKANIDVFIQPQSTHFESL